MGKRENDTIEAINKAAECLAMANIMEKRIKRIECASRILAIMGIIFPTGVGVNALEDGKLGELLGTAAPPIKTAAIITVIILGITQAIISACSIACKWSDNLKTYIDSKAENHKNAEKYYNIFKRYDEDKEKYAKQLEETNASHKKQEEQDLKITITEKEKRCGWIYALHTYRVACPDCGKIPNINQPSTCETCRK
jgi:mobilome CxxCx(11)CxxC protein